VKSTGVGSGPEPAFALESPGSRGRFKFTLVDGPGVPGFEPDVTGCDFFFRFEFLGGGLVVVEAIVDSLAGDGSGVQMGWSPASNSEAGGSEGMSTGWEDTSGWLGVVHMQV
jgi:hypothetical protein